MWDKMILGYDMYHIVLWFLAYSILGWVVESVYMSICNRKLTNRGFSRGPICPIYGVGALTVYLLLSPYSHNKFLLFLLGAVLATMIEWITARIIRTSLSIIKVFFVWKVHSHGDCIQFCCLESFTVLLYG